MSLSSWLGVSSPNTKRKLDQSASDNNEEVRPKKFLKNFNQNSYTWYKPDDSGIWHCSICRDAKFDNPYSRGHKVPAKTTNHERHMKSGNHLFAMSKKKEGKSAPMKVISDTVLTKDDENMINYLRVAYYLAREELPKHTFSSMMKLADEMSVNVVKNSGGDVLYASDYSVSQYQSAIADVIIDEKLDRLRQSDMFSITLDESTDVGNKKRLIMFVNYFHQNRVFSEFLTNIQVKTASADAGTLTNLVTTFLASSEIDIKIMCSIGTDGASVMTGRKSGVVMQLREHSPALIGVHCAAHRCALAASQAAKYIPEISELSRTISNIFFYFSNSALRSNKLREIQNILQLPELKYRDIHSVRWLSMDQSIEVVYRTFPALVVTLSHEANINQAAKNLLHNVTQYKFISLVHLMMDILPFLSRLSKIFQQETINFSTIQPVVSGTVTAISELNEVQGVYMDKLDYFVKQEGDTSYYVRPREESEKGVVNSNKSLNVSGFQGYRPEDIDSDDSDNDDDDCEDVQLNGTKTQIKLFDVQKNVVKRVLSEYTAKIVSNLEDRFQETSIVQSLNVLVPSSICDAKSNLSNAEFATFGRSDVLRLSDHLRGHHGFNTDSLLSEYSSYKSTVVCSYSSETLSTITSIVSSNFSSTFPNVLKLLQLAILLPISTVNCERGFSTQNRIVTKFRTSMKNSTLNDLMHICEDGPESSVFDFKKALLQWKKCPRSVYKCKN